MEVTMADIDDLGYKSVSEMSTDEAIEMLRQIRLNRRTPAKTKKASQTTTNTKKQAPSVDANQAAEILKILGGK